MPTDDLTVVTLQLDKRTLRELERVLNFGIVSKRPNLAEFAELHRELHELNQEELNQLIVDAILTGAHYVKVLLSRRLHDDVDEQVCGSCRM